jgi:rubrerythrin
MRKMTEQNLWNAFAGESQAHMKYLIYSDVAQKSQKPNIARLFKAISFAEQVHATNHLRALSGIHETPENLDAAVGGETFEVEEMYPVYHDAAKLQGEKEAERSTFYALEAEKIHARMYQEAKDAAVKGQDLKLAEVHVCPVCGYTGQGEPPGFCPVCGADHKIFRRF